MTKNVMRIFQIKFYNIEIIGSERTELDLYQVKLKIPQSIK